jgi:hypothetical protein
LKRSEVEKELRRAKRGVLNIQPLVVKLLLHSSSSSKCVKRKVYNEKIYFTQTIIQDINIIGTYTVEFLSISR